MDRSVGFLSSGLSPFGGFAGAAGLPAVMRDREFDLEEFREGHAENGSPVGEVVFGGVLVNSVEKERFFWCDDHFQTWPSGEFLGRAGRFFFRAGAAEVFLLLGSELDEDAAVRLAIRRVDDFNALNLLSGEFWRGHVQSSDFVGGDYIHGDVVEHLIHNEDVAAVGGLAFDGGPSAGVARQPFDRIHDHLFDVFRSETMLGDVGEVLAGGRRSKRNQTKACSPLRDDVGCYRATLERSNAIRRQLRTEGKRSFDDGRSQAGSWERGTGSHVTRAACHPQDGGAGSGYTGRAGFLTLAPLVFPPGMDR